jgi:hypothetical protein
MTTRCMCRTRSFQAQSHHDLVRLRQLQCSAYSSTTMDRDLLRRGASGSLLPTWYGMMEFAVCIVQSLTVGAWQRASVTYFPAREMFPS